MAKRMTAKRAIEYMKEWMDYKTVTKFSQDAGYIYFNITAKTGEKGLARVDIQPHEADDETYWDIWVKEDVDWQVHDSICEAE